LPGFTIRPVRITVSLQLLQQKGENDGRMCRRKMKRKLGGEILLFLFRRLIFFILNSGRFTLAIKMSLTELLKDYFNLQRLEMEIIGHHVNFRVSRIYSYEITNNEQCSLLVCGVVMRNN
jgi:hypothetical protein